jgi:lysozyme
VSIGGLWRVALFLTALALCGVAAWRLAVRWHPSVTAYPVQGVDVSEANGAIEWPVVKGGGADFGYAVAVSGAHLRDRSFQTNWDAMAAARMRRGAILRWSLCDDAAAQADAFNTVVPRDPAALPAAIAIAYDEGCAERPARAALVDDLATAIRRMEAHTGKPVLLKLARAVERDYSLSEELKRSIWETGNFIVPDYAARPFRMWQASDLRRVDGIDGAVNWDVATP